MAWKVDGKIGFLISNQGSGQAHWDTHRLLFQPPGSTTQEEIEKVYYLPASVCASLQNMTEAERNTEIAKWLIWHRYWEEPPTQRTLVMDTSGYVLIKYTPSQEDIVANTIGIFTTNNNTNGRCILILNENGILIGKSTEENIENNETLYGLTAAKRTMSFSTPFTFKVGRTYWIQYYFENCQSAPDAIFENETGTEYKQGNDYNCSNLINYTPIDQDIAENIVDLTSYTTVYELTEQAIQLSADTIFKTGIMVYMPYNIGNPGYFTRGALYSSNSYDKIYVHTDNKIPTNSELKNINAGTIFIVRKSQSDQPSNDFGVYLRGAQDVVDTSYWTGAQGIENIGKYVDILMHTFTSSVNDVKGFKVNQWYNWNNVIIDWGANYENTGKCSISHLSTTPYTDKPQSSDLIIGGLYYKNTSTRWGDETDDKAVMIYLGTDGNGENWKMLITDTEYTDINGDKWQAYKKFSDADLYEDITSKCNASQSAPYIFHAYNGTVPEKDISGSSSNNKKFYLTINGNEV